MKQIDLSAQVGSGKHRLTITDRSDTAAGYQVTARFHLPTDKSPKEDNRPPLTINLAYEHSDLTVGDTVAVVATIVNNMPDGAPMVVLDLPIPPGFAAEIGDFDRLADNREIAKYQVTPRSVIVYLRELAPTEPLKLTYHLRATMAVKAAAPPALAYEYYDPDKQVASAKTVLSVTPR